MTDESPGFPKEPLLETVVVERSFPQPVVPEEVECRHGRAKTCFDLHGVELVHSYISKDRRRMVCIYRAPDAEAVRRANDQSGLPFDRVWSSTFHTA
jgi:polyferredoxin